MEVERRVGCGCGLAKSWVTVPRGGVNGRILEYGKDVDERNELQLADQVLVAWCGERRGNGRCGAQRGLAVPIV